MSDCTNVEIRELLPEYLAGAAAVDRARLEAHLAVCEECEAELALLRSVREAYRTAPVVNVSAIVGALPRPRRRWVRPVSMLQLAAAISFISIGGISLTVARSYMRGDGIAQVDTATSRDSTLSILATAAGTEVSGISFAGGVSDLAAEDLEVLLSAIESLEPAPPAEPPEASPLENGRGRSGSS